MSKIIDLSGKQFDKLTVLERAENYLSPNGKRYIMWKCKCECGNIVVVEGTKLKSRKNLSCGCVKKAKKEKNENVKKMTEQDIEEWNALYEYVRHNILGYDNNQSLSKNTILRLKGLAVNKYIENRGRKDTASYSYAVILNTFKFCCFDIQKGFATHSFKDEQHKINYVLKIVENNLNTVYTRMQNVEKEREALDKIDFSHLFHEGAEYKSKTGKTPKWADKWW